MDIVLEPLFIEYYDKCPSDFKMHFRHSYEALEAANKITEVEGIVPLHGSKTDYKLLIDKSRIGISWKEM